MKKVLRSCLTAAAMLLITGCGAKQTYQEITTQAPKETTDTALEIEIESQEPDEIQTSYYLPQERVETDGRLRSYLTGELTDPAQADRRPIAIMMSNDKQALPQYGINRAGVVYEAPVEGGMNRYMALIEDYDDLERIGSVRSCRTYYTYFAREFDALYAHYGQSVFAKPYLENVDNINGLEGIGTTAYYRSSDRKAPHNAYSSGERLQKAIDKLGYSQEYDETYEGHYLFARDGMPSVLDERPGVISAEAARPGYQMNHPSFEYDPEDGLYHRFQYGDVHQGDEGPLVVKNVIFQCCPTGYYAATEYLDINVHTPERGYFMTEGKAIPITWEKDGEFGVTHYYDLEHNEIVLNQGKTWVCIIPTQNFDRIEITGKE